MTKSIRTLEIALGVQLLERTRHGVIPTAAGRVLLAHARIVDSTMRKAEEEVSRFATGHHLSVAVGLGVAGIPYVAPAFALFRKREPEARVRIVEGSQSTLHTLVRDSTLDFAVGQAPRSADPALTFRPMVKRALVVVGRKSHALSREHSIAALASSPWLVYLAPGSGGMLEQLFSAQNIPLPWSVIHCESCGAGLAIIGAPDTLGLLMPDTISDPLNAARFTIIKLDSPIPAMTFGSFRRSDAPLTPAAYTLESAFRNVART